MLTVLSFSPAPDQAPTFVVGGDRTGMAASQQELAAVTTVTKICFNIIVEKTPNLLFMFQLLLLAVALGGVARAAGRVFTETRI